MDINTTLQCLNEKIDLLTDTISMMFTALGVAIAIGGTALYFIAKQIIHSRLEEELPKYIKSKPPLKKITGMLSLDSSYDYNINRLKKGKIIFSEKRNLDDILFINIFYYKQEDPKIIEYNNPSLSTSDLSVLNYMQYKVPIINYKLTIEDNNLIIYIHQKDVPKDIFYEIVYITY